MADSKKSTIEGTKNDKLKKTKSKSNTSMNKKKSAPSVPEKNKIFQYLKQIDTNKTLNTSANDQQRHVGKNDFYDDCLQSKINLCASGKNCHKIKQSLKRKLEIMKEKEAQIQESIAKCMEINAQKDEKIKSLENQAEQILQLSAKSTNNSASTQTNLVKTLTVFEQFNEVLAENQLSTLRSIDKSTKGDSTFVLNCVRFIYSHDLEQLAHKSVTGASKSSDPKEPITPQKLSQLKTMYVERLTDLKTGKAEKEEREKKFNRHVHRAIININNAQKKQKENMKVINFTK